MNSINPFWQNTETSVAQQYLDALSLIERLHRLLLNVIKDEFERLGFLEINAVQALILFNIGENEVTAGELKSRGYYQGSNVSYNLKKLVDLGYMHHQRCEMDLRSIRVKPTAKGRDIKIRYRSYLLNTPTFWKPARICHLSMWIRSPRG